MNNTSNNDAMILGLNQEMLESVCRGDWATYQTYCHEDLTCFEAETEGHLVEGLAFHHFYFSDPDPADPSSTTHAPKVTVTMARPHFRWLSDDAVVLSYTRLTQRLSNGGAVTATCCETRIWQRRDNTWGQVHVHRS